MFTNPSELPKVTVEKVLPPDMVTQNPEYYLDQNNLNDLVNELGEIRRELDGLDAIFSISSDVGDEVDVELLKKQNEEMKAVRKAALEDKFIKVTRKIADFHSRTDNTMH